MTGTKEYKHDMAMMLAFHDALRRELGHIARVAASGTDDPRRVLGGCGLADVQVQPGCAPRLRGRRALAGDGKDPGRRPDDLALLAAMEAEHAAIDPLLNAIDATLANPASPPERLGDLTDALASTLHAPICATKRVKACRSWTRR